MDSVKVAARASISPSVAKPLQATNYRKKLFRPQPPFVCGLLAAVLTNNRGLHTDRGLSYLVQCCLETTIDRPHDGSRGERRDGFVDGQEARDVRGACVHYGVGVFFRLTLRVSSKSLICYRIVLKLCAVSENEQGPSASQ